MNHDSYAALPRDLQQIIDDNSGEYAARWLGQVWTENEGPGLLAAADSGELIEIAAKEVQKLQTLIEAPVQERWFQIVAARGYNGPALLAEARSLIEQRMNDESARAAAEHRQ